jgi:hypothetical protein
MNSKRNTSISINEEANLILTAKPIDVEIDKAKIKWPKRKKWRRPRGKTTLKPKKRYRPPKKDYYEVLKQAGRDITHCDNCGSTNKITIHHRNGNPFDNGIENLQVLCWRCHSRIHKSGDIGVSDELEGVVKEDYFW